MSILQLASDWEPARHFTTLASSSVSFLAFRARYRSEPWAGPRGDLWPGLLARANDVATPFPQHSWACHPLRRQAKRGPVAKGDRSARRTGSPTRARAARDRSMAALEAEAAKLLAALDAGTSSIDDVLGRLYGQAASPDVEIPRAAPGTTIATAPEYALGPSTIPSSRKQ